MDTCSGALWSTLGLQAGGACEIPVLSGVVVGSFLLGMNFDLRSTENRLISVYHVFRRVGLLDILAPGSQRVAVVSGPWSSGGWGPVVSVGGAPLSQKMHLTGVPEFLWSGFSN